MRRLETLKHARKRLLRKLANRGWSVVKREAINLTAFPQFKLRIKFVKGESFLLINGMAYTIFYRNLPYKTFLSVVIQRASNGHYRLASNH
jgi:hypothetical protein